MSSPALPRPELAPALLAVDRGEQPHAAVSEVHGSAAALVVATFAAAARSRLLVAVARGSDARDVELDLQTLAPELPVVRLPDAESAAAGSPEERKNRSDRERALAAARDDGRTVVIASLQALADATGDPAVAAVERASVRAKQRLDREELRRRLYGAGLEAAPLVTAPGEVSFRGDIVDFFPYGAQHPVRIEFFDDEVESLRAFDPETQRSVGELHELTLPAAPKLRQSSGTDAGATRFTVVDHFKEPPLVVRVDPVGLELAAARAAEESAARGGEWHRVLTRMGALRQVDLHPEVHHGADWELGARPIAGAGGVQELGAWAGHLPDEVAKLVVFSATASEGRRITQLLRTCLPPSPRRAVVDARGSLAAGFVLPSLGLWVGNHHELLSRTRLRRAEESRPTATRLVREMLELSAGEYVVHQTHGVGLFRGMREMRQEGGTEDHLELEFDEGTTLFVPASKIDLVTRYVGAGGAPPKLDRIGGKSWSRKKADVESALDEMSGELLELQAARKTRPGHPFAPDDEMQADFEASFPFADTGDQVVAGEEIKRDMVAPRAMDRLLCGDVGFGKTELAIRAAFKAAAQGKQVALLAPTTLLVRQHLEVFRNRMADWPIRVEALSRLTPAKKSKEAIAALRDGRCEIVIGSHRILSPHVKFKDLGLLIIDEEQRFGVKHKEALKQLKMTVDVLTLSATPIPRTLHMALVGLRDISTLREAPRGRQAVETRVTYDDDALVKTAVERELAREGQVFYLYNRVGPIQEVAARVRRLVPHARVGVAHGQMAATRLERVALQFAAGELDVLVCTTIIESGIDIPRVNTLIVERADLMGLADLHQLRGRIGRSDRKAYAWFFIPRKPLPAIALKRLRALEALAHLGAGFDIAIRDLEIRGAGNLLGREQSGHIASVGYDLYCRLLAKAIAKRRGTKLPPEPQEIDIGIGLAAFVPREYIRSSDQRMEFLRRLGETRGDEAFAALLAEMKDRYGRPPAPLLQLVDVFRLKECCRRLGIGRVFNPGSGEVLLFVRDYARFGRLHLRRGEGRHVEGSRVLILPPPDVRTPEALLRYLLEELRGGAPQPAGERTG